MWDPSGDDSYDTYIPEEEVNNWSNNYNNPSLLVSDFNYKMPQNLVESYLNNQFEYRLGQLMQINPTYKTGGWDCSGVAGYLVMGRDPSTGKFSTQDLLQGNVNGVGLTKGPLQNRDMIAFYYLGRSGREQPISGHVGVYYKGNIVDITGSANLQVREWDSWVRGYYNLAENHQFNIYRVNE
ncbi:MAG: hypothetical protein A2519_11815 [Candidatus Raymondbacteria bacterium RIFOXYD12_FULL_49_13]|uniref:NlpC/P60 domain-containing protein n=1 Tax=Candidatus Raymondbacteria bacterium RIFOXYD12_FULL_49_13 TaxID=1817890 RepID=A0A1F7FA81_UNCRA|nr:MAG: hypothetical protein A2519_11815 [Candidatus Raymondbacteria bacterium RIFOXYD12_FULL_49_13]